MTVADPTPQQTASPTPQPAVLAQPSGIPAKNIGTAYKWLFFFGVLGAHRFYMGRIGTGILWLLTGGVLGIGLLVDVFITDRLVLQTNLKNGVSPSGR
ncbi:MAG TPA: TM2 domain-containing protein [Humibacter sp.]|nr:TM2 domain-containing protein [Humibacter sp.]